MPRRSSRSSFPRLRKSPTGINGFDVITGGGLPSGRPALVCGGAGCGKSLFAAEFLIRGAIDHGEPGVLMTFEETADDIAKNVASLGFNVPALVAQKKLVVDHVRVERSELEENGEYDLEALFIRLDYAVKSIGARRVVLDTIETLFSGLSNQAILRTELRRLFGWLKARGLTTVITAERGDGTLTRQGLEEYVSDCVILLDHRVTDQISTRRLRVVKYRGSTHGTNEYPFLIDEDGFSMLPVTSSRLDYPVSNARIGSGIPELDAMLGGSGYFRGSTILLTGTAGTGKSSVAAHLAAATCRRRERCLYFSFEESPEQIIRNMKSIGIDLAPHVRRGLLEFHSSRPTTHGLEAHLARMHKLIRKSRPAVVILDPLSNLQEAGTVGGSSSLLIRLIDQLRHDQITAFFTGLTTAGQSTEATDEGVSSMVDTWLLVRDTEQGGERNRALYVLKSRGMAHSNQIREFHITRRGVSLLPVYRGTDGGLTGSARRSQEAREAALEIASRDDAARRRLALKHRGELIEAQIESLRAAFRAETEEFNRALTSDRDRHNGASPRNAPLNRKPTAVRGGGA